MAQTDALAIYGAGGASSLGLTLERHAAMVHLGFVGGQIEPFVLEDGTGLHAGFIDRLVLPPLNPQLPSPHATTPHQVDRLLCLADLALSDLTAACTPADASSKLARPAKAPSEQMLPLFLAAPKLRDASQQARLEAALLSDLALQVPGSFALAKSRLFLGGQTAFFDALAAAAEYALKHHALALVGAVDSYADGRLLVRLDYEGRLARVGDNFVPGEGACFLLLGPIAARTQHLRPWATLSALGFGAEPGHEGSAAPNCGAGLTAAVMAALTKQPAPDEAVETVLGSGGDELTMAKEWFATRLRCGARVAQGAQWANHSDLSGCTGVAASALHLATAAVHLQRGHMAGPALVVAAEREAPRAAAILRACAKTKLPAASLANVERASSLAAARDWYDGVADKAFDEAAFCYRSWLEKPAHHGGAPPPRAAIEQRLQAQVAFLLTDPFALSLSIQSAREGGAGHVYAAFRVALAAGCDNTLAALCAVVPWADRASAAAAVHAFVHAYHAHQMPLAALNLLAAAPERLQAWAGTCQQLRLPWSDEMRRRALVVPQRCRLAVVRSMAAAGDPSNYSALLARLDDRAAPIRRAAALGLLRLGERGRVLAMGQAAALGPWPLALAGGPAAFAALMVQDLTAASPAHCWALAAFGSMQAVPALLAALKSPAHRAHAMSALYLLTGASLSHAADWSQWWADRAHQYGPRVRYRLGLPYAAHGLLATLQDANIPLALRRVASHELAICYNVACRFSPRLLAPMWQAECNRAAVAVDALGGLVPGNWYYCRQYDG